MADTQDLDERIRDLAEELLRDWAQRSRELLAKRKATGALMQSVLVEASQVAAGIVAFEVAFPGYARILDMKAVEPGNLGAQAVEELKTWIRAKGVSGFVAGYRKRYGKAPTNNERLVNSIAWGIARSRGKAGAKKRRLRWYSRRKSGLLIELYDRVATESLNASAARVTRGLKTNPAP